LRLYFVVLTDSVYDRYFLVDLSQDIPEYLLKVVRKIFSRGTRATLNPELVNHYHFIIYLHLFLGLEDNSLYKIKLLTYFQMENIF